MNGKINNLSQVCSVSRYTLSEGTEKGLDIIDCQNGKIRFLLNASKALDIPYLYHQGQNISFISKNNSITKPVAVTLKRDISLEGVKTEINVIGLNADEALMEVDNFIDKAVLNNLEEVRIVHGKGMKILSTAIANRLRGNKNVKSYRFGKYGEGEHGVTIVKLK